MHAHHTTTPRHTTSPQPHSHQRRHHGLRSIAHQLTPETIEQIARRVAQLLHDPTNHAHQPHTDIDQPAGLLTATQLAHMLGVNRSWIYQNAHKLGAITLGNGPKPRLRFDPQTTTTLLAANNTPTEATMPAAKRTSQRGRPRKQTPPTVPLLPIHPRSIRGLLIRLPIRRAH